MQICNCVRCGHEWATRKLSRPDRCAKCTRPNWWQAVRVARIKDDAVRSVGRPPKYAVHLLNIGQKMTFPEPVNHLAAKQSITARGKKLGFVFEFRPTVGGLVVRRVL